MNEKWINSTAHLHGMNVALLADRLSFYDVVEGEVVRVYVDWKCPEASVFTLGGDVDHPLAPHRLIVGKGLYARDVYHYATKAEARRLRVGLTVHRGIFSSLPHAFEKAPVGGFEEAFLMVLPEGGKVLLEGEGMLGHEAVDAAWPLRHGDLVAVPMGWHRVATLVEEDGRIPSVAYVWGYLAKGPTWEKL